MTNDEKILQFQPVTIRDDMMFGTVMADPEYCRPFLETILGVRIRKIVYPEREKTIGLSLIAKSIRLDVYLEDDEHTVYDVEMQTGKNRNLPKRSRYYSGMIDLNLLIKGEDYSRLKKSLVIFICTFDPFGYDEYIYRCGACYQLSDGSYRSLGDDAWKIFVNTKGHKGNVSGDFKNLMHYILNGEAEDSFTRILEEKVSLINSDDEWKVGYMTWAMKLADERREAREEGRREGREEGLREGQEEGRLEMARKMTLNMLRDREPIDKIAKFLELPTDTVQSWAEEAGLLT